LRLLEFFSSNTSFGVEHRTYCDRQDGIHKNVRRAEEPVFLIGATGFVLESATNLSLANWQPAMETPTTNNGRWEITMPFDQPQALFPLAQAESRAGRFATEVLTGVGTTRTRQ